MDDAKQKESTYQKAQNATETRILSRQDVLRMLGECITSVHKKLRTGRNRDKDKDKFKENMLRVQGYLSNVYLQALKDLELQELQDRIEKLETARGRA